MFLPYCWCSLQDKLLYLDTSCSKGAAAERANDLWQKLAEGKNSYHISFPDLCLQGLVESRVVRVPFFF